MAVRPASRADLPEMAAVVAHTYSTQALFDMLHPHKDQYPEDWRMYWEREFGERMSDPSKLLLVSEDILEEEEAQAQGRGSRKIVGVCCWQRLGEGGPKMIEEMRDYEGKVKCMSSSFQFSLVPRVRIYAAMCLQSVIRFAHSLCSFPLQVD